MLLERYEGSLSSEPSQGFRNLSLVEPAMSSRRITLQLRPIPCDGVQKAKLPGGPRTRSTGGNSVSVADALVWMDLDWGKPVLARAIHVVQPIIGLFYVPT